MLKTSTIILLAAMWIAVLVGIPVMQHLEPEIKWYAPYAIIIALLCSAVWLAPYIS